MSGEEKQKEIEQTENEENNLFAFFEILLEVDKRVNPQNYEFKYEENDRYNNS